MIRFVMFHLTILVNYFKTIVFKYKIKAIKRKNLNKDPKDYEDELVELFDINKMDDLGLVIKWTLAVKEIASWFQLDMVHIKTTAAFRKSLNGVLPTKNEEDAYNAMLHSRNVRKSILGYMIHIGDIEQRRADFYLETHPEKKLWLEGNVDE